MEGFIEIGTLYLDDERVPVGTEYTGQQPSLRDAVPGVGISFAKWNGLYICAECLCPRISWNDLDALGFTGSGNIIKVDQAVYRCRLPKVGIENGDVNEWDAFLDDFGVDNTFYGQKCFWGQEESENRPYAQTRGGAASARERLSCFKGVRSVSVGFRPVLEPLSQALNISDTLVGSKIVLYGLNQEVEGVLTAFSDYDLIITPSDTTLPELDPRWAIRDKNNIVINRDFVIWSKRVS